VAVARLERGPWRALDRDVNVSRTSWQREIVLVWNSISSVFSGIIFGARSLVPCKSKTAQS